MIQEWTNQEWREDFLIAQLFGAHELATQRHSKSFTGGAVIMIMLASYHAPVQFQNRDLAVLLLPVPAVVVFEDHTAFSARVGC